MKSLVKSMGLVLVAALSFPSDLRAEIFEAHPSLVAQKKRTTPRRRTHIRPERPPEFLAEDYSGRKRVHFRGGFSVLGIFADPDSLNDEINQINKDSRSFDFALDEVGPKGGLDAYLGYGLLDDLDLGLGLTRFFNLTRSDSGEQTSTRTQRDYLIKTGITIWQLRAYYSFLKVWKINLYLSPSVGLGVYSVEVDFEQIRSNKTTQQQQDEYSSTNFNFRAAVGGSYYFLPQIGAFLETGFLYAESGELIVDSTKNENFDNTNRKNKAAKWQGSRELADISMSGMFFNFGLSVRLFF